MRKGGLEVMQRDAVSIVGGGLSGLAAALTVARRGGRARVFERRHDVGARFHGDFQGLENWSSDRDVLEEITSCGIEPTFEYTPFRECVFFDPDSREHLCRSSQPLWYLVRRGTEPGTLDQALKVQALSQGVDIQFGQTMEHLPDGGIITSGPRGVDAIVVGYVFATDRSDGAFAAVSDDLAPAGYTYLLICRGRATLATCMFGDFHNDKEYLARTVRFFERSVGITPTDARSFGGFANMSPAPTVRRGKLLLAGEAAGLQDALFGFGMRYALMSGHLAGRAFVNGDLSEYETAYRHDLLPRIKTALVNRHLYRRAGTTGYRRLMEHLTDARDPRAWLRRYYNPRWWTRLAYPLARKRAARLQAPVNTDGCREDCDCTYCRCLREAAGRDGTGRLSSTDGTGRRTERHPVSVSGRRKEA